MLKNTNKGTYRVRIVPYAWHPHQCFNKMFCVQKKRGHLWSIGTGSSQFSHLTTCALYRRKKKDIYQRKSLWWFLKAANETKDKLSFSLQIMNCSYIRTKLVNEKSCYEPLQISALDGASSRVILYKGERSYKWEILLWTTLNPSPRWGLFTPLSPA